IGNSNFRTCNSLTVFEAPVLTQIGNYNFSECNSLTTLKFGKHKLKVKCVDQIPFIIEREKTTLCSIFICSYFIEKKRI
ncbi:hypothetical protein, partial [Tenacibaculum maritimum]